MGKCVDLSCASIGHHEGAHEVFWHQKTKAGYPVVLAGWESGLPSLRALGKRYSYETHNCPGLWHSRYELPWNGVRCP